MRTTFKYLFFSLVCLMCLMPSRVLADISLPAIFADGMVLQQGRRTVIWGWARPWEDVTLRVSWDTTEQRMRVGSDATWSFEVMVPEADGQTHTIELEGQNRLKISDILFGEVILCMGQSNMEWCVGQGFEGVEEVPADAAVAGKIRQFHVDYRMSRSLTHDVSGRWASANGETVGGFTAIGWVVAREMVAELGVPVGIINCTWGGTPIECWMDRERIEGDDYLRTLAERLPATPWGPHEPGVIYNAMVAPLGRAVVSSILWYQGEANEAVGEGYADLLVEFVSNMRELFGDSLLPFVYAQIAPFRYGTGRGVRIREEQRRAEARIARSAMVVLGELGDSLDIHPRRKLEAGRRMADATLALAYGKARVGHMAPKPADVTTSGRYATVSFSNARELRARDGGRIRLFEVSEDGENYFAAEARVKGNCVRVSSRYVREARHVRYAWGDGAMPDMVNEAGIGATSFEW